MLQVLIEIILFLIRINQPQVRHRLRMKGRRRVLRRVVELQVYSHMLQLINAFLIYYG